MAVLMSSGTLHRKTRKYMHGVVYETLFPGYKEVNQVAGFERIEMNVELPNGEGTSVVIIDSAHEYPAMLQQGVELGNVLPSVQNVRANIGDWGQMHGLGAVRRL